MTKKEDHIEFVGDDIVKKAVEKICSSNLSVLQKLELYELKAIVIKTVKECLNNPEKILTNNQKNSIYNERRMAYAIDEIESYLAYRNIDQEYENFPENLIKDAAIELMDQEDDFLGNDYNQLISDSLYNTLKNERSDIKNA